MARISPGTDDVMRFSFKIGWDVEKTIEAIANAASLDRVTFKSIPTVLYSSLDGNPVELEISFRVDPNKKSEARHIILKAV